jgi:hypothetical protein
LIETKKKKNYKFVDMNAMALQDLLVRIFENSSKKYGNLNPLSTKQIKRRLFEALINIKNIFFNF